MSLCAIQNHIVTSKFTAKYCLKMWKTCVQSGWKFYLCIHLFYLKIRELPQPRNYKLPIFKQRNCAQKCVTTITKTHTTGKFMICIWRRWQGQSSVPVSVIQCFHWHQSYKLSFARIGSTGSSDPYSIEKDNAFVHISIAWITLLVSDAMSISLYKSKGRSLSFHFKQVGALKNVKCIHEANRKN